MKRVTQLNRIIIVLTLVAGTTSLPTLAAPAQINRYTDTRRPLEQRHAEITQLGKQGDAQSVQTLMALGNSDAYTRVKAIESLGKVGPHRAGLAKSRNGGTDIAAYLRDKLHHPEPGVACAAIQSLVRIEGTNALDDVRAFLGRNRERIDGFQSVVLPLGVKALAGIDDPRSVKLLEREIDEVVKPIQEFEYGSHIVGALARLGRPEGRAVLTSYASWLQSQIPADNPMVAEYIRAKRKEALEAAKGIGNSAQQGGVR